MKQLFLFLILIPSLIFGQGWDKTYGYGEGTSVQQTIDGGFIITGWTIAPNLSWDVYLIKTNSFGDSIWTRTYGGDYDAAGASVKQTIDGGYILTGNTSTVNNGLDVYLIKTNSYGDTIWTKTYGGPNTDYGSSVYQTFDTGYIITGMTNSSDNNRNNVYLIKTDYYGDTIWTKTYGGYWECSGASVKQTIDGGYVITGHATTINNGSDVYLIKTNSNGDTIWTKTYGGPYIDMGESIQQTNDGGYIVAGVTKLSSDGLSKVYLIKTDLNGDTLWTKTYGGADKASGYSIQQTFDGGYIITGYKQSISNEQTSLYLIKTDTSGDTLWTKTYCGSLYNLGYSVTQTINGEYIISGTYAISDGLLVYLLKTDCDGNIVSTIEIPLLNIKRKLVKIVDVSGKEITTPIANQPYIEIFDDGSTEKKLIIK